MTPKVIGLSCGRRGMVEADHGAQLARLVGADLDDLAGVAARRADHLEPGTGRAVEGDGKPAEVGVLVEDADGVGVADAAVGEADESGIAVVQDVDGGQRAPGERPQHDAADGDEHRSIEYRAWPDQRGRLPACPPAAGGC